MKVCFHVGPHRTGTTSIQFFLRSLFGGDPKPGEPWYPSGEAIGHAGGHGPLAAPFTPWRYAPQAGIERLEAIRKQAADAAVGNLLISSENFSFAPDQDLQKIRAVFDGDDFHLIITASSIYRRFVSLWAASTAFGLVNQIEESAGLLKNPGLRADYFRRMVDGLSPANATLIVSDSSAEAEQLPRNFFSVCGIEWRHNDVSQEMLRKKNQSMDYFKCQLMLRLNELIRESGGNVYGDSYRELRMKIAGVMRSPVWSATFGPPRPLQLPASFTPLIDEIASAAREDVKELTATGRLAIVGDADLVFSSQR